MSDLVPKEILEALRKKHYRKNDVPPIYYRWTYRPSDGSIDLSHNGESTRAHRKYHLEKAAENPEPDMVHGYAYRIKGGWRITDWEHQPVDPFIKRQVMLAIERKES